MTTPNSTFTDSTARSPVRIVPLLPSITEILAALGAADEIVGITHERDYPPEAIEGARVVTPYTMTQDEIHRAVCGSLVQGHSLYGLDADVLRSVRPAFVFTQSLCDICAVSYPVALATCARVLGGGVGGGPEVISMEPENLQDVLRTLHVAGTALGREERAHEVVSELEEGLATIRAVVDAYYDDRPDASRKSVAFMEWHAPIFTGGHWIPDMLAIAGGRYHMGASGDRSKAITNDEFVSLDPDVVLIGPCGFSLPRSLRDTVTMYQDHAWWRDLRAVRTGEVYALDGNSYYARPGPRLLQGCGIMAACIHHGEQSVVAALEDAGLAPPSGYCRVTPEMCETTDTSS